MKTFLGLLTSIFLLVCMASSSFALPLVQNAPFYADYINLEVLNTDTEDLIASGQEDNWGIALLGWYDEASIDSITGGFSPLHASSNPTWRNGEFGKELSAIFYDIDVVEFSVTDGNLFNGNYKLNSIGGKMDIWLNDAGTLNWGTTSANDRIGTNGFKNITDSLNSQLWLSLEFVAHDTGDGNNYTVRGGGATFGGDAINFASAYMSVTGGLMAQYFDTDYFTLTKSDGTVVTADLRNKNSFDSFNSRGWNANSEDPVEGFTATPEPTTMLLLGFGLLGLAGISRRKYEA